MNSEDIVRYNRQAWNAQVDRGNEWTVPVDSDVIARARQGDWSIILTPTKPVPRDWFPPLAGLDVLCLAGGGGQQGPILSAAGANVTVFDNSPRQLDQDRLVAEREGLALKTVQGDMADLIAFADASFDLIVHPCANGFIPDILPVWKEAYRVLRPGGSLLSGFVNPLLYLFDYFALERGEFRVAYKIPYSDATSLSEDEKKQFAERNEPLSFGHALDDQIGGQIAAGFVLDGFYEDQMPGIILSEYVNLTIATRASKRK